MEQQLYAMALLAIACHCFGFELGMLKAYKDIENIHKNPKNHGKHTH